MHAKIHVVIKVSMQDSHDASPHIFKPFLTGTSPKFKQGLACGARAQDQGHRWHERPSALADPSSGSAMVKGLVCPEGCGANVSGRCWAGSIARLCAGCGVSEPVSAVDTMERAGTVRLPKRAVTRRIKNQAFSFSIRNVYQEYSRCARPLHHAYTHTLSEHCDALVFSARACCSRALRILRADDA